MRTAPGPWARLDRSLHKVINREEFFIAYNETGQLVMLLQSEVIFDDYYRCYCIGGTDVRIMPYEPRNPHHLRYVVARPPAAPALLERIKRDILTLKQALSYDFNTVEFGASNGVPYAIDFCNPAPDADRNSVGEENFTWVVEAAAKKLIARANAHRHDADNLTWGKYVQASTADLALRRICGKEIVAATWRARPSGGVRCLRRFQQGQDLGRRQRRLPRAPLNR